jgi:preprotein translocase subunit SecB
VTLQVVLLPDLKWQPYHVEVVVAGVFRADRLAPALFDEFCRRAVPSILFPYVRQIVHTLTTDGAFGPVRLNPINIQHLLATDWVASGPGVAASIGAHEAPKEPMPRQ